jgi:hypothetical protein
MRIPAGHFCSKRFLVIQEIEHCLYGCGCKERGFFDRGQDGSYCYNWAVLFSGIDFEGEHGAYLLSCKPGTPSAKRWISCLTHMVFISSNMLRCRTNRGLTHFDLEFVFYSRDCCLQKLELVMETYVLWYCHLFATQWFHLNRCVSWCFVGRYSCAFLDRVVFPNCDFLAADTIYCYQNDNFFVGLVPIFKKIPMHYMNKYEFLKFLL